MMCGRAIHGPSLAPSKGLATPNHSVYVNTFLHLFPVSETPS
jgi:hypothetical protein